jgi:hypothetical protein
VTEQNVHISGKRVGKTKALAEAMRREDGRSALSALLKRVRASRGNYELLRHLRVMRTISLQVDRANGTECYRTLGLIDSILMDEGVY